MNKYFNTLTDEQHDKIIEYLVDGNDPYDLAAQLMELLPDDKLKQIVKHIEMLRIDHNEDREEDI
jgi:hypothetical protein